MKKILRSLTISFISIAVFCAIFYFALSHFHSKVQEEYTLLIKHSQKMLQIFLDKKNGDLYMLCILDYHINPNGKDMLNECKKIENINQLHPSINTKIQTPYYDFYMKYLQGILK